MLQWLARRQVSRWINYGQARYGGGTEFDATELSYPVMAAVLAAWAIQK